MTNRPEVNDGFPGELTLHKGSDNAAAVSHVLALCQQFWLSSDRPLVLTIEPKKSERSPEQNRALWGCAYEHICDANNIPKDWRGRYKQKLHTFFCGEYFGWKVLEVMGQKTREPLRTTTTNEMGKVDVISRSDCARFYEFIQATAAQGDPPVVVPDPDPRWFEAKEAA